MSKVALFLSDLDMSEKEKIDHEEEQEELSMLGGCLVAIELFFVVLLIGAMALSFFMAVYFQVKLFFMI